MKKKRVLDVPTPSSLATHAVKARKKRGNQWGGARDGAGRPPYFPEGSLAAACQQWTPAVIERFGVIATTSENEMAAIAAGKVLLDRGHGRAPEHYTIEHRETTIVNLTIEQMREALRAEGLPEDAIKLIEHRGIIDNDEDEDTTS